MKAKTHSGTKKRVKVGGKGTKRFKKSCKRHLLTNKSKRQKSIQHVGVSKADKRAIEKLLPNQ